MDQENNENIVSPSIKDEDEMENEEYMRNKHKLVKKWYKEQADLQEKYGKFPLFWQDLKDWKPWKDVQTQYLLMQKQEEKSKAPVKRKSRWADATSRLKKSRWEQKHRYIQPGLNIAVASGVMSLEQVQEIQFRVRVRELTESIDNVEQEAERISKDPNRSPSPPPLYDASGNRTNTRAMRMRRALDAERTEFIEELLKLNPSLRTLHHCRYQRKVYIPVDEYPDYNFVGQIMGPRGKSHRQLEMDTHTKIIVRGKGSNRDGKESIDGIGRDEPLHVIITGDDEEGVIAAEDRIKEICTVKDDKVNTFKQAQMRELAIINGQLVEGVICTICGERGHNQYNCPNRPKNFVPANVTCAICGETSHLTKDCPQRHDRKKMEESRQRDNAYIEFMNELEGRVPEKKEKEEKPSSLPPPPSAEMMMMNEIQYRQIPVHIPAAGDDMEIDDDNDNVPNMSTMSNMPNMSTMSNMSTMPNMSTMSNMSTMPNMSTMSNMSNMSNMSTMPNMPNVPNVPNMSNIPNISTMPTMPTMPTMLNTTLQTGLTQQSMPSMLPPPPPMPIIRPGVIGYSSKQDTMQWNQQNPMQSLQQMMYTMIQSGMLPPPPNNNH